MSSELFFLLDFVLSLDDKMPTFWLHGSSASPRACTAVSAFVVIAVHRYMQPSTQNRARREDGYGREIQENKHSKEFASNFFRRIAGTTCLVHR
ncbi:MAG TPA: hypothetical protein VK699_14430 [Terriglobales bacterium]|nr:hypothetical protein [Terriglobales bacterium]